MCQKCNQNTCNGCTQEFHICNTCPQEEPCDCPIKDFSTDCSTYKGDDIECSNVIVVPKNTSLSKALQLIVSWACTRFSHVQNYFKIINTGIGASIYAGDTLIGEKKLRKLKSTDGSVTITQGTDDINFSVEQIATDGSETKVTAGTNVAVTGNGTIATPYVINATDTNTTYNAGTAISLVGTTFNNTAPDQIVSLTQGGATSITGTYPNFTISSTDTNTTYSAGTGLTLSGTVFSVENLQKIITYPTDFTGTNYTISNSDMGYSIIIINGMQDVTITVPSGLQSKMQAGFIQDGEGEVTITPLGVTLKNAISGYKIKGQYDQVYLEQGVVNTEFYLLGNTKV